MKHADLRWNPKHEEWFCAKCGRTSGCATKGDAQMELERHDCRLPMAISQPRTEDRQHE